ncbi:hypothetical protein BLGI_1768 [Brevibacillus laterosporus GI-9]|nr:hypothetical protein BLGI_1768 [Brevibacillus laterosporus GI-9]
MFIFVLFFLALIFFCQKYKTSLELMKRGDHFSPRSYERATFFMR